MTTTTAAPASSFRLSRTINGDNRTALELVDLERIGNLRADDVPAGTILTLAGTRRARRWASIRRTDADELVLTLYQGLDELLTTRLTGTGRDLIGTVAAATARSL